MSQRTPYEYKRPEIKGNGYKLRHKYGKEKKGETSNTLYINPTSTLWFTKKKTKNILAHFCCHMAKIPIAKQPYFEQPPHENHSKRGKHLHIKLKKRENFIADRSTTMCIKLPIRWHASQFFKAELNEKGCGRKVGHANLFLMWLEWPQRNKSYQNHWSASTLCDFV